MKTINELVSKELRVLPLEENQVVEYRLIGTGELQANRTEDETGNKLPKRKPLYRLSGKHNMYDPVQQKNILIQNVVSYETYNDKNDEPREKAMVEGIRFEYGSRKVNWTEVETYCFLERHMKNIDNPFRKPGTQSLFFKVDAQKSLIKQFQDTNMRLDAELFVRDNNFHRLRSVAEAIMKKDQGVAFDLKDNLVLQNQLFNIAKTNPRYIVMASEEKSIILKLVIMDLERFNNIKCDIDGGKLIWKDSDIFGGATFAEFDSGSDKYNALVSGLMNESVKDAKSIIARLVKDHQAIVKGIKGVAA